MLNEIERQIFLRLKSHGLTHPKVHQGPLIHGIKHDQLATKWDKVRFKICPPLFISGKTRLLEWLVVLVRATLLVCTAGKMGYGARETHKSASSVYLGLLKLKTQVTPNSTWC